MTLKCPNCNKELALNEIKCPNCGAERDAATSQNVQTSLLNQPTPVSLVGASNATPDSANNPNKEYGKSVFDVFKANHYNNPGWGVVPPLPVIPAAISAEKEVEKEETPAETFPTFWTCQQCVSLNPSTEPYCENCGAPAPTTSPVKLKGEATNAVQATPIQVDKDEPETDKISTDVVAALAAESAEPAPKYLRLFSSSATDVGLSRRGMANEDSLYTMEMHRYHEGNLESCGLYIVADGMGGQAAGEVASRLAIQTVSPIILSELAGPWASGVKVDIAEIEQTLKNSILMAHNKLRDYNTQEGVDAGTTITACVVIGNEALFANVGDSRTYLFRPVVENTPAPPVIEDVPTSPTLPVINAQDAKLPEKPEELEQSAPKKAVLSDRVTVKMNPRELATDKLDAGKLAKEPKPKFIIERVTRDQSLVQQLVDAGELKIDDVYTDHRRNVILHALGAPDPEVPVDTYHRTLRAGDIILLCSDGLWEMIRDKQIAEQLDLYPNLHDCAQNLVALANQNGGADNIAVVLVQSNNDKE